MILRFNKFRKVRCDEGIAWRRERAPAVVLGKRRCERGSTLLVVFIFLTLMMMFVLANAMVLHHLRQEMRLIEQRQVQKFKGNTDRNPAGVSDKAPEKTLLQNHGQDPRP
jgi:hypothetical protein